jgi:hypothetical protein
MLRSQSCWIKLQFDLRLHIRTECCSAITAKGLSHRLDSLFETEYRIDVGRGVGSLSVFRLWGVAFVATICGLSGALNAEVRSIGQTVAASDTVQGQGAVRSKRLVSADPV